MPQKSLNNPTFEAKPYLDGQSLVDERLVARKRMLRKVLKKGARRQFRYTDHVVGEGERFFAEVERIGLEGMVAKKVNSFYVRREYEGKETLQIVFATIEDSIPVLLFRSFKSETVNGKLTFHLARTLDCPGDCTKDVRYVTLGEG